MPIFIELCTDAFEEVLGSQLIGRALTGQSNRAGNRVARRPTRGLEIKEDTYAAIKIILSDGSEWPLVDSSNPEGSTNGYTNFILQSVSETRMEKHQIVETFGASYIYFFGENPRFLDVSAMIINSHDFNWEAEWWANYEENFRGTRLVEKGGRLYMFYDDNIVEGYMLMCQATKQSSEPHLIPISFRLFLTNYRNVSFVGSPEFPIHEGANVTNDPFIEGQLPAVAGRQLPLRSLIADNFDEYAGLVPNDVAKGGLTPVTGRTGLSPADQARLETDDLHKETVNQLGARGADVDNPNTLSDLGMMPNFESDARAPASFRPKEKEAFGFDNGGDQVGNDPSGESSSFRQDPLGAIFGTGGVSFGAGTGVSAGLGDNRFTEGSGDSEYGFRSEFASGPGFGETGFGDLGGPGFGSSTGAKGDPGFKDPARFTFAGVAQQKAAFSKFRKPRPDQSAFGKGAGIGSSSSGLSGGASVRIGGKASPFSLISVPGTLRL